MKTEAIEEPSQEGGAGGSIHAKQGRKTMPLRAIIEAKLAIVKRSAEKEEVSRPQQINNSQITLRTRNTRTTADYS